MAQEVRASDLPLEEKQRQMSLIYSRRKRAKIQKTIDALSEQKEEIEGQLAGLCIENQRLQALLQSGLKEAASLEQSQRLIQELRRNQDLVHSLSGSAVPPSQAARLVSSRNPGTLPSDTLASLRMTHIQQALAAAEATAVPSLVDHRLSLFDAIRSRSDFPERSMTGSTALDAFNLTAPNHPAGIGLSQDEGRLPRFSPTYLDLRLRLALQGTPTDPLSFGGGVASARVPPQDVGPIHHETPMRGRDPPHLPPDMVAYLETLRRRYSPTRR